MSVRLYHCEACFAEASFSARNPPWQQRKLLRRKIYPEFLERNAPRDDKSVAFWGQTQFNGMLNIIEVK
jgi:hypothetical protein